MITVESVTKTYGPFTAVDDVSFTAAPGRVTGFLRPNGAGKSTTMRVIVGLTRATSEATVKSHVSRLFTKLDVTSRVQIAIVVHDADRS